MATSPTSATSVVFDASAIVRALVNEQPEALGWLTKLDAGEIAAAWPSHFYVETASALVRMVRTKSIERPQADHAFMLVQGIPCDTEPVEGLVDGAVEVALERGLSVYDALYVVLAEALGAPLVTADGALAKATEQGVLLPG